MIICYVSRAHPSNGEEVWEQQKRDKSCHNKVEIKYDDMHAKTRGSKTGKEGEEDYEINYEENNYTEQNSNADVYTT